MMINLCNYYSNDLMFNKFQIFDQDLSRYLASKKIQSQVLKLARIDSRARASKIASSTQRSQAHGSRLDQVYLEKKIFKRRLVSSICKC